MSWDSLNAFLFDIEAALCVLFAGAVIIYGLLYLMWSCKKEKWTWIKELYVGLGLVWFIFYGYVSLKTFIFTDWSPIPQSISRHLLTVTLASMAAGSMLRIKSLGIGSVWHAYRIAIKQSNLYKTLFNGGSDDDNRID